MGVKIIVTPAYQIAVVMERHRPLAEKHPALKCMTIEYRPDGVFYLKFGQLSVLGVGVTAEAAVVSACLTMEKFAYSVYGVPADTVAVLPIWVRKIAK